MPPGAAGRPSNFSSNETLSERSSRRSMNSSAMTFCTTFPGIGGMADARTKGEGLTGFAAVRREPSSPTEQMGAVAMVDVVADRVVEGVLDRVGTCANDADAGREPSPAVRKRKA